MVLESIAGPGLGPELAGKVPAAIVEMIERAQPGVVQVRSEGRGSGAGVIWDESGTIITNHHVIPADGLAVKVLLVDGRELEARVVGRNPTLDLALLKVQAGSLPAAIAGDSSTLRVGELVFAIGHPWGRRGVVTAGIISGLGEIKSPGSRQAAPYIRSDVRLAPGNSGGPLLNAGGEVIGINAMIFGGDLAVAIPSHLVKEWVGGLAGPPSRRASLGIGVQPVELRTEKPGDLVIKKVAGLLVVTVNPAGVAARNGLRVGDVLLEVDGEAVPEVERLLASLARRKPGQSLAFRLMRAGSIRTLEVKPEQGR